MMKRHCIMRRFVFYEILTQFIQNASTVSLPRNQAAVRKHCYFLCSAVSAAPVLYSNICKSNAVLANNQVENVRC